MFKRDDKSYNSALFHEVELQIENSSLDVEYTDGVLLSWDSSLNMRHQIEPEIDRQEHLVEQSFEKEFK